MVTHKYSFLIFLLLRIISISAIFTRKCDTLEDCVFTSNNIEQLTNQFNAPIIWFNCENHPNTSAQTSGNCSCTSAVHLGNQSLWELEWLSDIPSTTGNQRNGYGKCQIGANGPCGIDNNLEISCLEEKGFKCIQGRCRERSDIGQLLEGSLCFDTVQCQAGLTCQLTDWHYYYTESRCKKSQTIKGSLSLLLQSHPLA